MIGWDAKPDMKQAVRRRRNARRRRIARAWLHAAIDTNPEKMAYA